MNNLNTYFLSSLIFVFLISLSPLHAQLNGTYTIGDSVSDYLDFTDAVNDLKNEGFSGDVQFLVKPGDYYYVSIVDLDNPNSYQISFTYDGTVYDSAVIHRQLRVTETPDVLFDGFSIFPQEDQDVSCVWIDKSNNFALNNCNIINIYDVDFDYSEGLIKIIFPNEGSYFIAEINNCNITEDETTFRLGGNKCSFWIRNCVINGIIPHKKDNDAKLGMKFHYYDNIFYASDRDFRQTGQSFHGNTFYFESIFDLDLQGNLYNNIFHCNVDIASSDIIGNTFYKDVEMKWMNNADFSNNIVFGELRSIYSHGIKIRSNYLFGTCRLNNDNTKFGNNFVFDTVDFSHGPGQLICNNNFSRESRLELWYISATVKNNNLSDVYITPPNIEAINLENNNFIHLGNGSVAKYGENPFFYNPNYDNDSILYAHNPILIGKGTDFKSYFKYDIDSVLRKEPPSIGANEICFDWGNEELNLLCSDSLCLDLCIDTLENMYWSPSYLFDDSTSTNPQIFPEDSVTIYLQSTDGGIIDSLIINTGAIEPIAFANYNKEGLSVTFNNLSVCADNYLWEFGDGEVSTEKSPVHEYETDGSYQCNLTASNYLGDAYFTILLEVVSINENQYLKNLITIYPNPADNVLNIKSEVGIIDFSIINTKGQLILFREVNGSKHHLINVGFLNRGVYLLKTTTKKGISMLRFVKY